MHDLCLKIGISARTIDIHQTHIVISMGYGPDTHVYANAICGCQNGCICQLGQKSR